MLESNWLFILGRIQFGLEGLKLGEILESVTCLGNVK